MSSLPEKSQQITAAITATPNVISSSSSSSTSSSKPMMTKTFFFRSDSIRKIKCTAVYPFQVAGLKLSKSALIELLETNIKKARICTQKAMLNFYCMILKLLSTLFALWDEKVPKKAYFQSKTTSTTTSTETTALDNESSAANKTKDASTNTPNESPIQSYQSRIAEKLIRIQNHKRRLSGNSLIPSSSSTTTTPHSTPISTPSSTPSSSTNDLTRHSFSSSTESLRSISSLSKTNFYETKFQEYCLVFSVHAGLVVMYLQVVILGLALNTTNIPFGLIFMLFTIGVIGYIFVKVSLMNQKSMADKSSRSSPKTEAKKPSRRDPIKDDDFSPERQSRSKAKRVPQPIEFKYKTLSKVQLL